MQLLPYSSAWAYLFLFLLHFSVCTSSECRLNPWVPDKVEYTLTVGKCGKANFTRIQDAIDSVPSGNDAWIRILVSPGEYTEKVTIPRDKPCIYLKGHGRDVTIIVWDDHEEMDTSATFTSFASNVVAKGITFKNSYNTPPKPESAAILPALAARIYGDKSAFYNCGFVGFQDTLWDVTGRHYFHRCYIQGAIDFIFGDGQSLYERCEINLAIGQCPDYPYGYITAQNRMTEYDSGGFVFKSCYFNGVGEAYLGRAWGPYSRVIIADSWLANLIVPQGWDAWRFQSHVDDLTYVEFNNNGPGANISHRVDWQKKADPSFVSEFLTLEYINNDKWMENLPDVD